nr:26S protease regulatory subunit 8 homolog A [Tanacetum cinerariifolium]
MAALRYKDEHNKVGYLLKPTGSDDYHQIIDFLRASHIRYALTHNPIIFDSLVKQFWSMATLKAPELGLPAIQATIDKTPYIITKELVKVQRQQTSDPNAPVLEHGQSLDPNTASFSRSHKTDAGPFTNVEDAPVGNTFHISSPRSTQAPPAGQPSGDVEDPITLTTLSSIVSTLVQKFYSLETELKDHKKLFKDVVGELVKKVKAMEVKQKTKKRKIVVSDSDQEDSGKQEMDLDALRTLANAAVIVDTNIPPGNTSQILAASPSGASTVSSGALTISPGASTVSPGASSVPASSLRVPTDVSPSVAPVGVSYKGKSLMVDEDIPIKVRTFKKMQEDILGYWLPECQRYTFPFLQVKGQNRLEVVQGLDERHLQSLQQVLPKLFPSEMVLQQSTLGCSPHSLYLNSTIEYVIAMMQRYVYARMESGSGNGDNEVKRTMLELLNQLDGFEASNIIKVSRLGFVKKSVS